MNLVPQSQLAGEPYQPSLTLRDYLKNGTRAEHESLEQQLDLLRSDFNLDEYKAVLGRFYGFYAPWERLALASFDPEFRLFYADRLKVPLLESDLRYLGIDTAGLPLCSRLPTLRSAPAALGSLYVIEGSTLGGQLLTRHLGPRFHLADQGLRFFRSYGDQVGPRWRAFLTLLEEHSQPENLEPAAAAARETFGCLSQWCSRPASGVSL